MLPGRERMNVEHVNVSFDGKSMFMHLLSFYNIADILAMHCSFNAPLWPRQFTYV
jgi:hypothetical protein